MSSKFIFNDHHRLVGKHAFLSASKFHWINYPVDGSKIAESYYRALAVERGTELHDLAAKLIKLGVRLEDTEETLNRYVNDAIDLEMAPEHILYYSDNCFGTADAIVFDGRLLRIHDLKTGIVPAHIEQLEIYAALFCLEYDINPADIDMELRLYQSNDIRAVQPTQEDIVPIIDRIVTFDRDIDEIKLREGL